MNIKIENITVENVDENKGININISPDGIVADGVLVSEIQECAPCCNACCETTLLTNLDAFSWKEIDQISKSGKAPYMFALGAVKNVTLKNGEAVPFRIIGFDHDMDSYGNFVGITWDMPVFLDKERRMNSEWTNSGGWEKSEMRKWLNEEFFNLLPDDLKCYIKAVTKLTSAGSKSTEIKATTDKLWLLSEHEIYGRNIYSVAGEGSWYAYYKQENVRWGRKHKNDKENWGWLRSPSARNDSHFCMVHSDGVSDGYYANYEYGVFLGFCF